MSIRLRLGVACLLVFASSVLAAPTTFAGSCNTQALTKTVFGTQSSANANLQQCLIAAGYTIPAGATGYFGGQTVQAIKAFYTAQFGIVHDGRSFGPQGRAKLATLVQGTSGTVPPSQSTTGYKKVGTATELAKYVAERDKVQSFGGGLAVPTMAVAEQATADSSSKSTAPTRVSETTVQVAGIDEPDIVKTDGEHIYVSKQGWYGGIMPMVRGGAEPAVVDKMMMPIWQDPSNTLVVDAFPAEDLQVVSKAIEEKGEMLLVKDKKLLIILSYPSIVAYDVANPAKPVKKWTLSLEQNTSLVTTRLNNGTLYLVAQTWIDSSVPCPVVPIMRGNTKISIPCADIWVPTRIEPVTTTYTVLAIDPTTGTAKQTLAFAADGDATTVSMFADNLYLASKSYQAPYTVLIDATITAYTPHLSAAVLAKMRMIASYDISLAGKYNEITQLAQTSLAQKTADERMKVETEVQNTIQKNLDARKRELDRTRITRIPLANLSVGAVGEVPGSLLNQFSLDEYQGDVRVAVTVGQSWFGAGETANDVYVLGADLKQKGRITDLGLGERVYAARFMGDTAYVVTFKQIDPFYVLDLSVPTAPKLSGELKIPGYSAYLEPLGNNLVLGVGRENNGVKLSIFDVSNPSKPVEKSTYLIKDAWSEVEGNHHAFLRDADHQVFFIPGGNGGYVFSYAQGKLGLKATIAGWSVKRAVYIDDSLYVIGDEKITILDERTWKVVKELKLP
jgi:inhibitor of cysteine peptidase